jgi:hypothetical protein
MVKKMASVVCLKFVTISTTKQSTVSSKNRVGLINDEDKKIQKWKKTLVCFYLERSTEETDLGVDRERRKKWFPASFAAGSQFRVRRAIDSFASLKKNKFGKNWI